jgi:uncharacterized protein
MKTQEEMNTLVPQKLREIEKTYDVTVLWAVESGSRAWGFASPDSDFDVRFIYKRKPEAYLKLNKDRDVIELPIDDTWDVSGWDLDKTLILLRKSNPTVYEWLHSPIKYWETDFGERLEPLMREYFSEEKMLYHYLNTAKYHIKEYLSGDRVKPKKYFYALRPILACTWVRAYHTAPPVLFDDLRGKVLPGELKEAVDRLLDLKINGPEKMEISPIPELNLFLNEQVQEIEQYLSSFHSDKKTTWDDLNRFFIEELQK